LLQTLQTLHRFPPKIEWLRQPRRYTVHIPHRFYLQLLCFHVYVGSCAATQNQRRCCSGRTDRATATIVCARSFVAQSERFKVVRRHSRYEHDKWPHCRVRATVTNIMARCQVLEWKDRIDHCIYGNTSPSENNMPRTKMPSNTCEADETKWSRIWTTTDRWTRDWIEPIKPSQKCVEAYRMITNEINSLMWLDMNVNVIACFDNIKREQISSNDRTNDTNSCQEKESHFMTFYLRIVHIYLFIF
jgi:hypothetical protein